MRGASVFYPALSTDSQNNLVVLYGSSSSTKFPDLEVVGQLSTMAPNTVSQAAVIVAGTAADLTGRWGDYSWAATDPATPNTFWVSGEYRTVGAVSGGGRYRVYAESAFAGAALTVVAVPLGDTDQTLFKNFINKWQAGGVSDLIAGLQQVAKQIDDQNALG